MRILMIAPEIFYQEKGTPLSVFFRAKALCELGYKVDLLTYPVGKNIRLKNLQIIRSPKVPFIRSVKAGPSAKKLVLDFFMFFKLLSIFSKKKYRCVYTHEEAGFFGALLKKLSDVPHVYDMHSSMPLQLKDWDFSSSKLLKKIVGKMERFVVNNSSVIVPICENLAVIVRKINPEKKVVVIENTAVIDSQTKASAQDVEKLRNKLGLQGKRVVLYTGTFLPIQGLDLMIKSIPFVRKKVKDVIFVFVGGRGKEEMDYLNSLAAKNKVLKDILILESVPKEEVTAFMGLADVLASPRSIGINAPLKLFSYMKSGKPIIATDLPIHTQILTSKFSLLAKKNPKDFAEGTARLLLDREFAGRIADNALSTVENSYSYKNYKKKLAAVIKSCSVF